MLNPKERAVYNKRAAETLETFGYDTKSRGDKGRNVCEVL